MTLSLTNICKQILLEQNLEKNFQVFCDLDGVLVDFHSGLTSFVNSELEQIKNNPYEYEQASPELFKQGRKAIKELGNVAFQFKDFEKETSKKNIRKYCFMAMDQKDVDFWSTLNWASDGKVLWDFVKKFNPYILSSPVGESKGKVIWCQKNLALDTSKIILSKDKFKYAKYRNKTGILIDDMNKNIVPFIQHGGVGILHKSAEDTIAKMQQIINKTGQ